MLRVSHAVKPFSTVLLTGDGGDDVFLGYRQHPIFLAAQRAARFLPTSAAAIWPRLSGPAGRIPALRRAKHFLDYATGGLGAVAPVHNGLPFYDARRMRGDRLKDHALRQRQIALSIESGRRLLLDTLNSEQETPFV